MALCVGARGAIAQVERASLALERRDAPGRGPRALPAAVLSAAEANAWTRVVDAFRSS